MSLGQRWVEVEWAQPQPRVHAFTTTRALGDAKDLYADGALFPQAPLRLEQVHGSGVWDLDARNPPTVPLADAVMSSVRGRVCAVRTADCLPVFVSAPRAAGVAMIHAGWRSLVQGIIEATLRALREKLEREGLWSGGALFYAETQLFLGPAVSPARYRVGADVYEAFIRECAQDAQAFTLAEPVDPPAEPLHYWMDIRALALARCIRLGIPLKNIRWSPYTTADAELFYSARAGDQQRMISAIYLREHEESVEWT